MYRLLLSFIGYKNFHTENTGKLSVYNWGEYLDPEAVKMFEEETGIEVTYDEYETNEAMYPIIAKGAAKYDLVCPSDYMIQRMKQGSWRKSTGTMFQTEKTLIRNIGNLPGHMTRRTAIVYLTCGGRSGFFTIRRW